MADALKAAGDDAVSQGDYNAALALYEQALAAAAGPDEVATLHSDLSSTYLELGQLQQIALSMSPEKLPYKMGFGTSHGLLGITSRLMGSLQALQEADKVVAANKDWNEGYFRRGEAHFALKEYEDAVNDYAKASELAPEDGEIANMVSLAEEAVEGFYFRQLLPGRDFCLSPTNVVERQIFGSAEQMRNYVYLIGDAKTRECVVVDACWDVKGIRDMIDADKMKLVGAIVTHYHFDHVGGVPPPPFDSLGIIVPGIREMAVEDKVKVYVNKNDAQNVHVKSRVPAASMVVLEDSSVVNVGSIELQFIHTPGHTPGSQCIHIPRENQGILLSGDTLFIGSCGRLDFPDCDPKAMFCSLQQRLASLPDNTKVYPGHHYGGSFTTIADEKKRGILKPLTESQWLEMHLEF